MLYYIRIYFKLALQYFKIRMHYRQDFIVTLFSLLSQNMIGFMSIYVIFNSINSISGWDFYELVFLYAFALLAGIPQQLLFDNVWNLPEKIRSGEFIRYYFRPLNMLFYYMSEVVDFKCIGTLIIGVMMIGLSSKEMEIYWSVKNILLLIFLLICASLVVISMMLIAASLGFWFVNTQRVLILMDDMKNLAWYPMNIYSGVMNLFFTFVIPVGFIAYYPTQIFFGSLKEHFLVYFSPLVGIGLFLLAYKVWSLGVNHYTGTGS